MSAPTRSHTISVTIARPPAEVYDYVTDPRNLPSWASGLATGVERRGDRWVLHAGGDELLFEFAEPNAYLVADHVVTQPDGSSQLNPMRVLPNGDGCEVLFTLFRAEAADDAAFAALTETIEADLAALRRELTGPQAVR